MTNIRSLSALYLANAREFIRDRLTFFLVVLLPVALAIFFGLIFGGVDEFTLQVGVVDEMTDNHRYPWSTASRCNCCMLSVL